MPTASLSRRLNAKALFAALGGPALVIPREGWNADTFAAHGHALIYTMAQAAKVTQRRAIPGMARTVKKFLDGQIKEVIRRVLARVPQRAKATIEFSPPIHEAVWAQAIREALAQANIEAVIELTPPIQSVMAQGYSKVGVLLANDSLPVDVSQGIARRARDAAQKITRINDTTRLQMERSVKRAIEHGLTVQEAAAKFGKDMGGIASNRALTIARTELNNAWSQGAKQQLKECRTLTHISVIGCESREEDRWGTPSYQPFMYQGESTCNIEDVPIVDIDLLFWHPNHTGTIVPSRFMNV